MTLGAHSPRFALRSTSPDTRVDVYIIDYVGMDSVNIYNEGLWLGWIYRQLLGFQERNVPGLRT